MMMIAVGDGCQTAEAGVESSARQAELGDPGPSGSGRAEAKDDTGAAAYG